MNAPSAQTLVSALLASAALFSLCAVAQPRLEREIAITGAPNEPPAVLYAEPDVPLSVVFDAPLKKDVALAVPGADVRPHPFVPNALVITPSKPLAGQSSFPVQVPMAEGAIALTIAFSPARRDASVRIVHRASSGLPAPAQGELKELLRSAAHEMLDPVTCAAADTTSVPRQVNQDHEMGNLNDADVCGGGAFTYLRIKTATKCRAAAARLTRGEESEEVLLLQPATGRCTEICWLMAVRTPRGDGRGFALELLAENGSLCQSFPVNLKPHSP